MTTDYRVRVLLDVDGVLNAVVRNNGDPQRRRAPEHFDDFKFEEICGFPICYSETVISWVKSLADDPRVDLQWLTTWEENANTHLGPAVGLPELPVAGHRSTIHRQWWKLAYAKFLAEDGLPFVWIDDDLNSHYDDGAARWVVRLEGQGLAISPKTDKGLTQELIDIANSFIQAALEDQ